MGVEIDWSKAPEGAIAALVRQPLFVDRVETFHEVGVEYFRGEDVSGFPYRLRVGRVTKVDRPSTWTGEGLPPAGTVCEVLNNTLDGPEWERCTILFMGKFKAVYESESCHERVADVSEDWMISFRPIRTPEQIAAEEREKAIDEIAKILDGLWSSEREAAGFLHDAGYRKVTP